MTTDPDYELGRDIFDRFVRGDALIGLVPDVPGEERKMMDALWAAAQRGSAAAYRTLGECYFAVLRTIGAFEGIDPADAEARPWSTDALAIEDDNPALQAAMRAYDEAARRSDREGLLQLARVARHSTEANKRIALARLEQIEQPRPEEVYQRGLVHHWLGELERSHACHVAAAERGDADAMFELYIYYAQGLGCAADVEASRNWLDRAATAQHPRALYNVGTEWASGKRGEPDLTKAAEFYERAAGRGNGRAAANLAVMILTGEREGSRQRAAEWLDRADELGFASWEMLELAGVEDPRNADGS